MKNETKSKIFKLDMNTIEKLELLKKDEQSRNPLVKISEKEIIITAIHQLYDSTFRDITYGNSIDKINDKITESIFEIINNKAKNDYEVSKVLFKQNEFLKELILILLSTTNSLDKLDNSKIVEYNKALEELLKDRYNNTTYYD